ncbi:uncharacterized protein MELLADRAFT_111357 [Melampsora larici-populina 98AG31]|uniref:CCHC-type domain-containing protein n=1 Tax=Melampsora larici-populina (strain 98AG31 / pathotype 3-4-7) TaxID=747676 RepID=F4S2Y4_MELLP|nr:uncharacterized protein MELLADRAFT_111357 [Melampsora larici-populina 98AG31]EGG00883.1 hypothetical protein MELLADRAFT_111357 [Melampsora larici-populina 98AG31]
MSPIRNVKIPTSANFAKLDKRTQSEMVPWKISTSAHHCVKEGLDQCIRCGRFGHLKVRCTTNLNHTPKGDKPKKALPYPDWRRVQNGKKYSIDVLNMSPRDLAKAVAEYHDDTPVISMTIEEVAALDAIEAAGPKTSQGCQKHSKADTGSQNHSQAEESPAAIPPVESAVLQ